MSKNVPGAQWFVYDKFTGLQTKLDPSKIDDGASPVGQNTTPNEGDKISIRPLGLDIFPSGSTLSTSGESGKSIYTFRKRSGENIFLRTFGAIVQYFEVADTTNAGWKTLKGGFTAGQSFGFTDMNVNTDQTSYTYFCNGVESVYRWTGNHTYLTAAAAPSDTTITVASTTGFPSSGSVSINGTEKAYSSKTATSFVLTTTVGSAIAQYAGVAEVPTVVSSAPVGNILMSFDNRLFIVPTATPQCVYFSKYGDPTNFTAAQLVTSTTATDPGIFNLVEGGGGVTGMTMDESSMYIFKRSIIYKVSLTDSTYSITPLKTFDQKSQTSGSTARRAIFTGGNQTYFITPDNKIFKLSRVEYVDYPQFTPISDIIKPTTDLLDFTQAAGIVFQDRAFIACKSSVSAPFNDIVLVWNDHFGAWDTPILGWNGVDFSIYNDGTGDKLYFITPANPNVFKVTSEPTDYIYDVESEWYTKYYNFGDPTEQKEVMNVFIEGYISDNTGLNITLQLDENGFTQEFTTTLDGTESNYTFGNLGYNTFGANEFGRVEFGVQDDLSGKKPFRVYLNQNFRTKPCYVARFIFGSSGKNQQWEITRYGFLVRGYSQPERATLYRQFA